MDPQSIDIAQSKFSCIITVQEHYPGKRWKAKYEEQFARNDKLRKQLQQLEQHLSELKLSCKH